MVQVVFEAHQGGDVIDEEHCKGRLFLSIFFKGMAVAADGRHATRSQMVPVVFEGHQGGDVNDEERCKSRLFLSILF